MGIKAFIFQLMDDILPGLFFKEAFSKEDEKYLQNITSLFCGRNVNYGRGGNVYS